MSSLRPGFATILSIGVLAGGCTVLFPFATDAPADCRGPEPTVLVTGASAVALAGDDHVVVGEWSSAIGVYRLGFLASGRCGHQDFVDPEGQGSHYVSGIVAERQVFYAAKREDGVAVLSADDRCNPGEEEFLAEPDAHDVLIRESQLYVAAGEAGVTRWDLPATEGTGVQVAPVGEQGGQAERLTATPSFTVAALGGSGQILFFGPEEETYYAEVATSVRDVAWADEPGVLVVAAAEEGLAIVGDLSRTGLGTITKVPTSGLYAVSVAADGRFVFVCGGPHEGSSGLGEVGFLDAYDVSDPANPRRLWAIELPETCWDMVVGTTNVLIADDGHVVSVERGCAVP